MLIRIGLNSLVLAGSNIVCIIIAYGLYYYLRPANQIAFQAPVAAILSIAAFLIWLKGVARFHLQGLYFETKGEFVWSFLLALLWSPLIFWPLHFGTQGYMTVFSNITAIWLFQVPTNGLAIVIGHFFLFAARE